MRRNISSSFFCAGLSLVVPSLLGACASSEEVDEIASYTQALNACDETVPANRNIDGFPAYAQCSSFEAGPIYSNNGVDTSATKVASDWVQTQGSGGYQCTEIAHRYWLFKWNIKWLPRGNAGNWCDTVPPATSGVVQTTTPVHGDVMVLAPGSCGASASTGHAALVDVVDPNSQRLTVIEQNPARRGTYQQSCAKCFLHIVANDVGDAGVGPAADAGGSAQRPAPADAGATGVFPDAGRPVNTDPRPPTPVVDAGVVSSIQDAGRSDASAPGATSTAAQVGDAMVDGSAAPALAPQSSNDEPEEQSAGCSLRAGGAADASSSALLFFVVVLARRVRRRSRANRD